MNNKSATTAIWFNRPIDDEDRRARLYRGEIFVYDRVRAVEEFAAFTRGLIEEALAPHDPRHVHEALRPEELAPLLGKLKPAFTHHPESRRLLAEVLRSLESIWKIAIWMSQSFELPTRPGI